MSEMDAGITCWDTKYFYFYPRPTQMDADIKTLTGIPNFPAYASGHSTFSAAASTILGHLFPDDAANLDAMAKEASVSRLYGGIHYSMDCQAGLTAGTAIGNFAIARAKTDGGE
jgi:membrane-associated phospholipid phosphatase